MKQLKKIWVSLISIFFILGASCAQAKWDMNLMEGVTPMSQQIFGLHMFAIWVCVGIGVVVYGVMIYSIIHHRKSKGAKAAHFHGNILLEIVWSVLPIILLIVLAIPATQVLSRMEDTKNADITVKITGYQWKWQYEYLDQNIRFFSNLSTPVNQIYGNEPKGEWYLLEVDKPLVLPVHKKVRFLVTSNDVIHAWWVPDLGVKRDAIPGFIHESWANIDKPGIYRGQCAELCGVNHGFMPIVVEAVTDEVFEKWVAEQKKQQSIFMNNTLSPLYKSEQKQNILDEELRAWVEGPEKSENFEKSQVPAKIMDEELRAWITENETETEETASKKVVPTGKTFEELMTEGKEQYGKYCMACHREDGLGMPPLFPALKGSSIAVGKSIARHISLILTGVPGTAMQAYADQLTDDEIASIVTYERNAWANNTGDVVQASDVIAVRQGANSSPVTMKNKEVK